MILPIMAQLFEKLLDFGNDRAVRKNDRCETSGISLPGQLVQVSGNAFELGHVAQMLAPHPFFHSAEFDQFADDLGGLFSRLAGEGFQLKI